MDPAPGATLVGLAQRVWQLTSGVATRGPRALGLISQAVSPHLLQFVYLERLGRDREFDREQVYSDCAGVAEMLRSCWAW